MLDLTRSVLEEFAAFTPGVGELRITNKRRDNELTAEFRRERRAACPGYCACGAAYETAHGRAPRTRCAPCQVAHYRRLRAARDKGRKR